MTSSQQLRSSRCRPVAECIPNRSPRHHPVDLGHHNGSSTPRAGVRVQ
jgi:hypothetical protein